jgi:hypothetical protein
MTGLQSREPQKLLEILVKKSKSSKRSLMRKLGVLVFFAAMSDSSVLAKEGLLNSSYEEVASILGKPSSHDNGGTFPASGMTDTTSKHAAGKRLFCSSTAKHKNSTPRKATVRR